MAVYWIDPHTTTNGTGTFASPWAYGTITRTTFVSDDEVRIVGVALTSLLTATTYTATYTDQRTLTITAGGSLGADFAAFNIVYLPDVDAFFKITSVSTNNITVGGNATLPWYNSSTGQTNITVRRVDTGTYGVSATGTVGYILNNNTVNNITVTDGWTDETTRVTDGTVKTLFHTSSTTAAINHYPSGNISTLPTATGVTFDLANTHILPGNSTSGSPIFNVRHANCTMDIGQVQSSGTSSILVIGNTTYPLENLTLTFNHLNGYAITSGLWYGRNLDLTVNNLSVYYFDYSFSTSYNALSKVYGAEITFGKILSFTKVTYDALFAQRVGNPNTVTLNFNDVVDMYGNLTLTELAIISGTNLVMNFGGGFEYRRNRRATLQTSVSRIYGNVNTAAAFMEGNRYVIPDLVTAPTGWSVTSNDIAISSIVNSTSTYNSAELKRPFVFQIETPITLTSTSPNAITQEVNLLCYSRDGAMLKEVLGVISPSGYSATTTAASFPIVTKDTTTIRTTGPSLRSLLTTRNTTYWTHSSTLPRSIKNITIPILDGNSYTITGYIRTDQAGYTNGDCIIGAYFENAELDSQSMTTSCINNWEQFTLTFTATKTGEAYLAWEMYYSAGNSSYWLDDLEIASV